MRKIREKSVKIFIRKTTNISLIKKKFKKFLKKNSKRKFSHAFPLPHRIFTPISPPFLLFKEKSFKREFSPPSSSSFLAKQNFLVHFIASFSSFPNPSPYFFPSPPFIHILTSKSSKSMSTVIR